MIVCIPILVPFRYPLLIDWLWIYIRHYKTENQIYVSRKFCQVVLEIPDLPQNLIESLEEVGCEIDT